MKITAYVAAFAAAIPAVWSLPQGLVSKQFKLPTCGAEACLSSTNGTFVSTSASNGTAPGDLGKLCSLPQEDVTRYVKTVQPCVDGKEGKAICTAGAIYQYKDLLERVCASDPYQKTVQWA